MNAIALNKINHRRLENYARLTGQPVSVVLEEALTFWMDTMGDPVLEELERCEIENRSETHVREFLRQQKRDGNLLSFPAMAVTK